MSSPLPPTSSGNVISIIVPCLNEEHYIAACLDSILRFERPEGVTCEILVVDGGSTDATLAILGDYAARQTNVRVLANPRRIQAVALNLGIQTSRGQWIMRLDAHTLYPPDYLAQCYAAAIRTGAANTGGLCITLPGGKNYQAQLVQALTTHRFGVGDSGFRTGAEEGPRDTVPFGFFRREVFDAIGFFDERLVRAQDYEFNRRIRASGRQVWLTPAVYSEYFNQPTLRTFYAKQLFREAPYNAYLWYLAPYAFAPRHAVTGVFSAGVIGGAVLSPVSPWFAWPFLAVMALYTALACLSALQQGLRFRQLRHVFLLPFCFFGFHFLHGLGLLAGLGRLATGTAPVQRRREPWPGAGLGRAWPRPAR